MNCHGDARGNGELTNRDFNVSGCGGKFEGMEQQDESEDLGDPADAADASNIADQTKINTAMISKGRRNC